MKKKKIQYKNIIAIIFIITSIYLINAVLLFDNIETFLRYLFSILIIIFDLFLLYRMFFGKKKKKRKLIYSIILVLFSILFVYVGSHLNLIYSYFAGMNKKVDYTMSLVTLKENNNKEASQIKNVKIGINKEGDTQNLSEKIIKDNALDSADKKNEIKEYQSNIEMIKLLYDKELDYIFLPSNYAEIYNVDSFGEENVERYETLAEDLVIVSKETITVTKEEAKLKGSSKDVSEPFTILLVGIDSTVDGLQNADSFNGDSLIVVTFNPKTFTATMLSIPRDSYVPITCMNNVDNKITHSAGQGGTNCVIKTVQNYFNVTIDYYMKINFTGVVELVDAVGGVEMEVPYALCEQNSKRQFGNNTVYIEAGHQTLNGEQALAFARNRKNNSNYCSAHWTQGERSDFVRAAHQQEVIQAIIDKLKGLSSINDLENILKIVSKNLDTNMDQSTMFSFYNVFKDVLISSSSDKVLNIQKLYLDGTGQMIYDERSKLVLWDYIVNQESLAAVKKAMKDNLSGKKQELIKTFTYEIGETYKTKVIGEGYSGTKKYDLLISLEGKSLDEAQSWASSHGLSLSVEYVKNTGKKDNTVIEQEYPVSKRIDLIPNKTMKVKVVKNSDSGEPASTKVDCTKDTGNTACKLPNLIGKTKDDFETWGNGFSNKISRSFKEVESDKKVGTIVKIEDDAGNTISVGTLVKDLLNKKIVVSIAKAKSNNSGSGTDNGGSGNGGTDNGESSSSGTDNGGSSSGGTDNGGSSSGGTDNGGSSSGGTDNSGSGSGETDNGGSSSGGTDNGGTNNTPNPDSGEESNNP